MSLRFRSRSSRLRLGLGDSASLAGGLLTALAWLSPSAALAEGTAQLGTTQALRAGTQLGVDVVNAAAETIVWTGAGTVDVYSPSGAHLRTAASGQSIAPASGAGAYTLRVNSNQLNGSAWAVTVQGQQDSLGRLFSKDWQFDAGSFASSAATNASFYALVPTGASTNYSVIELKLDGLAGFGYDIYANQRGVNGSNGGRSVVQQGNTITPQYRMYLRVPALANFATAQPGVANVSYVGGVATDVSGAPMTPCNQISPGNSQGYFSFTSQTDGSYQVQCDLDGDGKFDVASGADLLLIGTASAGTNVVAWDGTHNGANTPVGTYSCRVRVTIGEFHYIGTDIETSYPGMRIFRVNSDLSRTGLAMYWNDAAVQSRDVNMPSGVKGLVSSEGTVVSGAYTAAAVANTNARSWGNFTSGGKGNETFLDTYVWLDASSSSTVPLRSVDATDSDGDGLTDYQESCLIGSSVTSADTDANGIPDGQQYAVPNATAFAGLESNGRLATALARRAIRKMRMSIPTTTSEAQMSLEAPGGPASWLPDSIGDSTSVVDTPHDLLDLTNASTVAGSDYVTAAGKRRGGALIVDAVGALYEHQKAICDRVKGARLLDVRAIPMRGVTAYESTLSSIADGRLEYSISLHLWNDVARSLWVPTAFWVKDDAPSIPADAQTVALQAWGDSPEFAQQLIASILVKIEAAQAIAWPVEPALVDDAAIPARASIADASPLATGATTASAPSVLVQSATSLGGQIDLSLRRASGVGGARIRVVKLEEDATTETTEVSDADVGISPSIKHLAYAPFLEATVDVLDGERVVDRVWLSDGAWAPFDDGIWQGASLDSGAFSRKECRPRDLFAAEQAPAWRPVSRTDTLRLSGCAVTKTAASQAFGGLARQMMQPLDASRYASLTYWIKTDDGYDVCLEGEAGRRCVPMPAHAEGGWEAIPTTSYDGVTASVQLITFTGRTSAANMEVSGLEWLNSPADTRRTDDVGESSGCVSARGSKTNHGGWVLALAVAALGWRRKTSRDCAV